MRLLFHSLVALLLFATVAQADIVGPPVGSGSVLCDCGTFSMAISPSNHTNGDILVEVTREAYGASNLDYPYEPAFGDLHLQAEEIVPLDESTGLPIHDPVVVDLGEPWSEFSNPSTSSYGTQSIQHQAYIWHTHEHHSGYWRLRATSSATFDDQHGVTCLNVPLEVSYDSLQVTNLGAWLFYDRSLMDYSGPGAPNPEIYVFLWDSGSTDDTEVTIHIYSAFDPEHVVKTIHQSMSYSGSVVWDGTTDAGGAAPAGLYGCVVQVEHQEDGWSCTSSGCQRNVSGGGGADSYTEASVLAVESLSVTKAGDAPSGQISFDVSYSVTDTSGEGKERCEGLIVEVLGRQPWIPVPGESLLLDQPVPSTAGFHQVTVNVEDHGDGPYYFVLRGRDSGITRKAWYLTGTILERGFMLDTTPPDPGTASSSPYTSSSPIAVTCTAADDHGGSGVKRVELRVKKGAHGAWVDSGLAPTGGSCSFTPDGEGTFYFDLVAEDNAGNRSPAASGDGDSSTIYEPSGSGVTTSGRVFAHYEYLYPGGPMVRSSLHDTTGARAREVTNTLGAEGELLSQSGSTEPIVYAYDAAGRVKSITNAADQVTNYIYDDDGDPSTQDAKVGNLTRVEYPGGEVVRYSDHDAYGRPLTRTDAKSVVTKYHYDDIAGLLTHVEYPATPEKDVYYEYDPAYGRVTQLTDGTGVTTYAYDDLGLPTSVTTTYSGLPAQAVAYSYWPDSSPMTVTTPAGDFSYTYDAAGRPIGLTNPNSDAFSWGYLNNNWLHTQTTPVSATTYTLNERGLLSSLVNRKVTDQTLLSEYSGPTSSPKMAYDTVGNLLSMTVNVPSTAAHYSGTTSYSYQNANYQGNQSQLTSEQSTRNLGYSNSFFYDSMGNPTTFEGNARGFSTKNERAGSGFAYDGNGNPTTYNTQALTFDAENRMVSYGSLLTAGYTVSGLRAWKESTSGRTYFLYAGGAPVVEMDDSGVVTAVNTFGPTGLLSRREGPLASGTSKFYTFDPQGNVSQVLGASGSVTSTQLYDAFGSSIYGTAAYPYGSGGRFGYYTDQETNLALLGHRYYDPEEGRFLNRDPIGYAGGMNLYGYTGNNPVNSADPSGFCAFGTAEGASARDWYADQSIRHPWNPVYYVGGTLASMWTPETYKKTSAVVNTALLASGAIQAVRAVQAIRATATVGVDLAGEAASDADLGCNLETHHLYPNEHADWFAEPERGITVNDHTVDLPDALHRFKSGDGLHTNQNGPGTNWNADWDAFKQAHPNATAADCEAQLNQMLDSYGVANKIGRY